MRVAVGAASRVMGPLNSDVVPTASVGKTVVVALVLESVMVAESEDTVDWLYSVLEACVDDVE